MRATRSLDDCSTMLPSFPCSPTDWTIVRWVGLLVLAWGVAIPQSGAQPSGDAVGYSATVFAAGGSGASLPFWLSTNRYGVIDPASANAGLMLAVHRPFQHRGLTYAFGPSS